MGKIKTFRLFNENVSSNDLEDIRSIMNIASDANLDVNIYEREIAKIDHDLTLTINHLRNKIGNEELIKTISDVITRIDFLCQERAYKMSWKIHRKRSSNERPGHAFNGIIREDDEIMKGWADRGYPAWGLNGIGEIQGIGMYLDKIQDHVNEASYIPCEITEFDVTDIEMILNLAYDDGVKVVLQTDKADDLTTINRVDLVNQDNQLTDTEFNHVVANIYQRLCDVGVFRGYKEFQTTASTNYNDDDFDFNDDDEEPLEDEEEWGGDNDNNYNLGPTQSFRAVSIFRKIRRKGTYENISISQHHIEDTIDGETAQDIGRILDIISDEADIDVYTFSGGVQFYFTHERYDFDKDYYERFIRVCNDVTNRLINLGIVTHVVFYSDSEDNESVIPPDRQHQRQPDEFKTIGQDLIVRYLKHEGYVINNISVEYESPIDLPPEERVNESNGDNQEVQQILNIARDEDIEVHCSKELSIRICKPNDMSDIDFFKMCITIDERLIGIGSFKEGVVTYDGIRGMSYTYLSELKSRWTEDGMQANVKKIYDYSNAITESHNVISLGKMLDN